MSPKRRVLDLIQNKCSVLAFAQRVINRRRRHRTTEVRIVDQPLHEMRERGLTAFRLIALHEQSRGMPKLVVDVGVQAPQRGRKRLLEFQDGLAVLNSAENEIENVRV